jgi:NH3-dependent NAD+ synthetase
MPGADEGARRHREEIDMTPACRQMLVDIGHPFAKGEPVYDITFENVQAGAAHRRTCSASPTRTTGMVLGTGDLSELALGWCTYGVGDHMSHYNVNGGVPKTLIQHLIRWVARRSASTRCLGGDARHPRTEISPELVPGEGDKPSQKTEDFVGPYALQDFNLFYITRYGFRPARSPSCRITPGRMRRRGDWPPNSRRRQAARLRPAVIKRWLASSCGASSRPASSSARPCPTARRCPRAARSRRAATGGRRRRAADLARHRLRLYPARAPLLDGSVSKVAAFVEKPDQATAERYVLEGYLWNSGNFAFKASTLLAEFEAFEPSVAAAAKACVALLELEAGLGRLDRETFAQAKKISLDYAVMEHTTKAAVVPAAFAWSDLGAWDAIWEASVRDVDGNAQDGDVDLHGATNVLVRTTGPYVGVIGVSDIVVVAEPDAVLVCHRKDSQAVKILVDGLKAKGRSIGSRKSAPPSGTETLVTTDGFDVELRRVPAGETFALPVSTVQLLEGVLEMDGDVYAAGALIPLDDAVSARAIGAATLLVTKPR